MMYSYHINKAQAKYDIPKFTCKNVILFYNKGSWL